MKLKTFAIYALSSFMLLACSASESGNDAEMFKKESLQLALRYVNSSRFDSLVVHGEGADTLHYVLDFDKNVLDLELYPALWKFSAKLYAGGLLMQEGSSEIEIVTGENAYLTIQMKALIGFIDVVIPLGLNNHTNISKGTLTLSDKDTSYSYALEIKGAFGYFKSDALALNSWYAYTMELFGENGEILYTNSDYLYLEESNASVEWSLTSLKSNVSLSILEVPVDTLFVNVVIPGKKMRTPTTGDALFSEFLAIPKAGSNYEFIELYNATLDTLVLDDCLIKLKASSNSSITIPKSTLLLPASYLTIGADSTAFIHPESWFSNGLTNTKASLILTCESSVIDSIAYSASAKADDDSIRIVSNSSSHLDLSYWEIHDKGGAWCIGENTPNAASSCYVEEDVDDENADFTE